MKGNIKVLTLVLALLMGFIFNVMPASARTQFAQCTAPMVMTGTGLNRACVCPSPYVMINGVCQAQPTCPYPQTYSTTSKSCICPMGMTTTQTPGGVTCSCPSVMPYWCQQQSMCVKDSSYCYSTCSSTKTKKSCNGGYYYETCSTCPGSATSCTSGLCNVDCMNGIDPVTAMCKVGGSSSGGSTGGSGSSGSSSGGGNTGPAALLCDGSSVGTLAQITGSVSTYSLSSSVRVTLENGQIATGTSSIPPTYTVDQNAYNQLVCLSVQEALDNAAKSTKFYVKNNPGLDCMMTVYKGSGAAYSYKCHTNTVAQ